LKIFKICISLTWCGLGRRILFLDKGVIAFDGLVDEFFNSQNERIKSFISAMDI